MNKINSIKISGIRGIKQPLELNLNKKSILVYGDNGSGKSSITDAFEWFYYDKIGHLISEETGATKGKGALRNLFLDNSDDATIKIECSKPELSSQKSINSTLKITQTNISVDFSEFLKSTQSENLILRYKDLVRFIIATKKEKLDTLQEIIGFSKVGEIRDLLRKNAGRIARNINAARYDNKKSIQQTILIENFGQNITSATQFFEVANELIKPLKSKIEIKSSKNIKEILKEIESTEDTEVINKINFLSKVNENLSEIAGNIDSINSDYDVYYMSVADLKKEKEKVEKLQILNLLLEGQKLMQSEIIKDDVCPLCQQDKSKTELVFELNQRIEELEELKKEKEKVEQGAKDLQLFIQKNLNLLNALKSEKLFNKEENETIKNQISDLTSALEKNISELIKNILSDELLQSSELSINKLVIQKTADDSKAQAKTLSENQKKNPRLQIHTKLSLASQAYGQYNNIVKEEAVLRRQQFTFEALFADFIKRQELALNVFLEMFSQDINDYYTSMNPNEKVENIKLVPLKDGNDDLVGITIEYDFYDETKSPPIAYLSESHINCLGLAFYLASVKAFNKQNGFFILDDIISSFDRPHRTRFARLLTNKFDKFQILLFTHEREFYELIASEVKSKGWLLQDLHWTKDNGTVLKIPLVDYKSQIEEKFNNRDTNDLGNLIRKYLERQLKSISYEIEAKVAYRNNEINEKRMAPELLDAVQGKLSKTSKELKDLADIPKIKGMPMLLGNTTSHDNEFQESIEDLQVMWDDTKSLIYCFFCTDCNKFISIKNYDTVENKIRCSCGKIKYEWKL
jgi:energy-coupling factor transporter ATP-binding protein EcfA2